MVRSFWVPLTGALVAGIVCTSCRPGAAQRPTVAPASALAAVLEIVLHDRYVDVPKRTIDGCAVARVTGASLAMIDSVLRPVLGPEADSGALVMACDAEGRRQGRSPLYGWRLDSLSGGSGSAAPDRAVATLWDGELVYQRRYRLARRGTAVVVRAHEDSGWSTVDGAPVIEIDSAARH
jgi:hypothetical protein